MAFELAITSGNKKMIPAVVDGIDVEWSRQGTPGQMTFTVLKDSMLSFNEGDCATLRVDGYDVFWGYIVKKSRDKEQQIQVTCLDQLFYLAQNQSVCLIEKESVWDVMQRCKKEIGLQLGKPSSRSPYKIPKHRIDSATSYLDILQTALDITLAYSGEMFVIYDDFGRLTLRHIDEMKTNSKGEALLIDQNNAENFDYETSIENSYNEITLWQSDGSTAGEGKIFEAAHEKSSANQKKWGRLNYFEILDKDTSKESAKLKAKQLLELHNQVKRKLSVKGVFSAPFIRGGSSVLVSLTLGDLVVKQWFMVESVKHHFANDHSTMDMDLRSSKGFVL